MDDESGVSLVTVFDAGESDALPLATLALDQAGIEYTIKAGATDPLLGAMPMMRAPSLLQVRETDEARAREVLAALLDPASIASAVPEPLPASTSASTEPHEIALRDAATGELVGAITDAQLHILIELLEEADDDTPEYYVDGATIDMLIEQGVDPDLVATLRRALGARESIDLRWSEAAAD